MSFIDLHTHTRCSDGTYFPAELVLLAKEKGLEAIAITDHDAICGNASAIAAGKELGITVMPGIEISVKHENYPMHILGYCIDSENLLLLNMIDRLQDSRNQRNPKIVAKLQALGFDITYEEVLSNVHGKVAGRPHIAMTMVKKGFAGSIDEAFHKYLHDRGPAYVSKEIILPEEAFSIIKQAGGVSCLAHPWVLKYNISKDELKIIIEEMVSAGLQGIEVYYGKGTAIGHRYSHKEQVRFLLKLAKEYKLVVTGGSDFHGDNRPDINLGQANVPAELLKQFSCL
ncbi:MAG: PHP domain-containing protein [Candidatus Margulisiibacteriota bacterium]